MVRNVLDASMDSRFPAYLRPSETIHRVIIHHADRLHVGVADGAADEAETAPFQVATHGVRYGCAGRNFLHASPGVPDRPAVHKAPLVGVEGAELLLHLQEGAGIGYCGFHLQAIAYDAGVSK